MLTSDFRFIILGVTHHKRRCLTIERVARVGVSQELGKEDFKDIYHICVVW